MMPAISHATQPDIRPSEVTSVMVIAKAPTSIRPCCQSQTPMAAVEVIVTIDSSERHSEKPTCSRCWRWNSPFASRIAPLM